jgi:hypothetical protein
MHRPHGIEVVGAGRALEQRPAWFHLQEQEIERAGDGRVGQLAAQHHLHHLQAAPARHLPGLGDAAADAGRHAPRDLPLLGQPLLQWVRLRHRGLPKNLHLQ